MLPRVLNETVRQSGLAFDDELTTTCPASETRENCKYFSLGGVVQPLGAISNARSRDEDQMLDDYCAPLMGNSHECAILRQCVLQCTSSVEAKTPLHLTAPRCVRPAGTGSGAAGLGRS